MKFKDFSIESLLVALSHYKAEFRYSFSASSDVRLLRARLADYSRGVIAFN